MATASKSSGRGVRKTTSASKRTRAGGKKTAAKSASGTKRKNASKNSSRPSAKTVAKTSAKRGGGTRSARKQSPVTRIKRVATSVLQQGATAAKQGVQAVERLVEGVKDRVAT